MNENYLVALEREAIALNQEAYTTIVEKIGDASVVLLGEATHGTQEFYDIRAEITRQLITQKGFTVVAIEGDWPDAYHINRYIRQHDYVNGYHALSSFDRFPTWMWKNMPMVALVEWLQWYNQKHDNRVHFYGLDLYSLYRSIDTVIEYLHSVDPALAAQAQKRYACFDNPAKDPQHYGYAVWSGLTQSCKEHAVEQLKELHEKQWNLVHERNMPAEDAWYIVQNARVIKNAERYYRSLFIDDVSNWNVRDSHMMETVQEIRAYHDTHYKTSKIIIWAHNSHCGNAAATQMSSYGEYNIGQLAKEMYGTKAFAIGFTTYAGTVSAASNWHAPVERKVVRKALEGSYEHLFHSVDREQFVLSLENKAIVPDKLLERAIGVIYAPHTERMSHYFYAQLAQQFDMVIHCDTTQALEPIDKSTLWIDGEVPETYPYGV